MYIAKFDHHKNIYRSLTIFSVRKLMPFDINLFQINWIFFLNHNYERSR